MKEHAHSIRFLLLCLVFLVFLIVSIVSVSVNLAFSVNLTTVSVSPSFVTAGMGENFIISVDISNVTDLFGWEFKLGWNSSILEVVDVVEGDFLRSGGETFFYPRINNTSGYVIVDCTLLGNVPGVSGDGILAVVEFYVKTEGESILDLLSTTLVDSGEQEIPHQSTDGYGIFTSSHDVAVIDVVTSHTSVLAGQIVYINATVENQGRHDESVNVTSYYGFEIIQTQFALLEIGERIILTFEWDTTGVPKGDYVISSEVSVVPNETEIIDNVRVANNSVIILSPGHDIAIEELVMIKTVVGQGLSLNISVTVKNYGNFTETFNVTIRYNDLAMTLQNGKNYSTVTLGSGDSLILTFTWNTTNVPKDNYTISGAITILPEEIQTEDNSILDGWVIIAMIGDLTGPEYPPGSGQKPPDGACDMRDVAMVAKYFGETVPPAVANCDLTGSAFGVPDGEINMRDIGLIARHFGETDP
ncbi:MAG: hypothetical protein PVF96_06085 [Candidatus Bathyarchaeota archaeon]